MIRRVVMLKLNEAHANAAGRAEIVQATHAVFGDIQGVQQVQVGVPGDPACEGSWDIMLQVDLANVEAIPVYIEDPVHQKYVNEVLVPRVGFKKVWNFELA